MSNTRKNNTKTWRAGNKPIQLEVHITTRTCFVDNPGRSLVHPARCLSSLFLAHWTFQRDGNRGFLKPTGEKRGTVVRWSCVVRKKVVSLRVKIEKRSLGSQRCHCSTRWLFSTGWGSCPNNVLKTLAKKRNLNGVKVKDKCAQKTKQSERCTDGKCVT